MSTEELLKVLDMGEEAQVEYFYIKGYRQLVDTFPAGGLRIKYDKDNNIVSVEHSQSKLKFDRCALADLAFRLRDEAISEDSDIWAQSCWYVQQWIGFHKIQTWNIPSFDGLNNAEHEILTKEPIVWIVAALIALKK